MHACETLTIKDHVYTSISEKKTKYAWNWIRPAFISSTCLSALICHSYAFTLGLIYLEHKME